MYACISIYRSPTPKAAFRSRVERQLTTATLLCATSQTVVMCCNALMIFSPGHWSGTILQSQARLSGILHMQSLTIFVSNLTHENFWTRQTQAKSRATEPPGWMMMIQACVSSHVPSWSFVVVVVVVGVFCYCCCCHHPNAFQKAKPNLAEKTSAGAGAAGSKRVRLIL